jgi:hypothetical protein
LDSESDTGTLRLRRTPIFRTRTPNQAASDKSGVREAHAPFRWGRGQLRPTNAARARRRGLGDRTVGLSPRPPAGRPPRRPVLQVPASDPSALWPGHTGSLWPIFGQIPARTVGELEGQHIFFFSYLLSHVPPPWRPRPLAHGAGATLRFCYARFAARVVLMTSESLLLHDRDLPARAPRLTKGHVSAGARTKAQPQPQCAQTELKPAWRCCRVRLPVAAKLPAAPRARPSPTGPGASFILISLNFRVTVGHCPRRRRRQGLSDQLLRR